ncbi:MAG: S41 family peptidase [Bacteroidetes bacterium]|nr:S41 family peptidase [Bacteroidota bacterium]MBT4412136.1 S41 family peptidase [Bacteroidota bacterium]MBT7092144.1 S41 family peptidase [Bacteroidota bacterium]MBT7464177.1 S41 family peptidase [Bacteroidota bacterium]
MIALTALASFQFSFSQVQNLDSGVKGELIDEIVMLIEGKYVFPEVGSEIAEYIQNRNKEGAYAKVTSIQEFIQEVTNDLQSVNKDAHLGLVRRRGSRDSGASQEEMIKNFFLKQSFFQNFGFKKVDRLLGNVGYIVLDEFSYLEMDGKMVGEETARAVMQVMANTYALILDLRDNFGGREEMALLLMDYFFESPTHVLTNKSKSGEEGQIWTEGKNKIVGMADIPIYILTSHHTVSGGEMFAYVMKNRNRATIIGEKTRGAAHKTHLFSLKSAEIDLAIPLSTTIDPLTGTDWEGKGVEPDIAVSSGKAFDVAYKMALVEMMQGDVDEFQQIEIDWTLMEIEGNVNPSILNESSIQEYVGVFEDRNSFLKDGVLCYQKMDQQVYELAPMSKDLFSFVDQGMFFVRIRFTRDQTGLINKMFMIYDTGKEVEFSKTVNQ